MRAAQAPGRRSLWQQRSFFSQLVEEPRVAREYLGWRMIALEVGEAIVARLSPQALVGKKRLDARRALGCVAEHRVDRRTDVDGGDRWHAARPRLQEDVGHALVHRRQHEEPRAIEPALDRGERQEAGE